jgi:hypothetical protein
MIKPEDLKVGTRFTYDDYDGNSKGVCTIVHVNGRSVHWTEPLGNENAAGLDFFRTRARAIDTCPRRWSHEYAQAEKRPGVMIQARRDPFDRYPTSDISVSAADLLKAPPTEEDTLGSGMVSRIDRNRGEVTITLANVEDVVNFELGLQLSTTYMPHVTAGYVGPAKQLPMHSERTCATCSKTCDVGVKCWWCGNE